MVALSQKEIRQRTPWLLLILLLINFALMAYDARDPETNSSLVRGWAQVVASPAQNFVAVISGFGTNFFANLGAWRTATAENAALKERVGELETEIVQKQNLATENERLKALLDLRNQTNYKIVAAQVIARDPSAWFDTVIINRGRTSGIELNMPVTTTEGVAGRVIATSPFSSQVLLLTDDKSAAAAIVGQIGKSNAVGSIRGTGNKDLLELRYVAGTEKVEVGETVLTTGQDQIYPAGLKVGEVTEIKAGSANSPQTILVKPGAPIGSLQEVSVLLYAPPPRPAFDQTLTKPQGEKNRKK